MGESRLSHCDQSIGCGDHFDELVLLYNFSIQKKGGNPSFTVGDSTHGSGWSLRRKLEAAPLPLLRRGDHFDPIASMTKGLQRESHFI